MWKGAKRILKRVPGMGPLAHSAYGQALRHRLIQHIEDRTSYTFTQFYRAPGQLDALCGPVLDFLAAGSRQVRIVALGCSTGAEAYTLASELLTRHPRLEFTIDAFDISADVLAVARSATYPADWVRQNPLIMSEFIARTFVCNRDEWKVRDQITERVHFYQADVADPAIRLTAKCADIVLACNIMCNLQRPAARRLFQNAVALLKSRAALFVDGMDLDMRVRLARQHQLVPLTFEMIRIHEEARLVRGDRYPWFAAGLEPFSTWRRNREFRYATIFLRDAAAGNP